MLESQVRDYIDNASVLFKERMGEAQTFLGVIPGTGCKKALKDLFREEGNIPYQEMNIPGSNAIVDGHDKSLQVGTINGRPVMVLGRSHANEQGRDPMLPYAMRIVIGAVRDRLDGLVITHGAGTLHGPVDIEKGRIRSLIQTAVLDVMGWAVRGRRKDPIAVGDLAIVEDVITRGIGSSTPLLGGEFIDFYRGGIHRDDDRFFNLGRAILNDSQGYAPRAVYCHIAGPQFEGPADKRYFRAMGGDVIGMSAQDVLSATQEKVPFVDLVLATNGPFEAHSHSSNQAVGDRTAPKLQRFLEIAADRWPKRA